MGRLLLAAILFVASTSQVFAVDLANVLADYTIASWSQRDGLPAGTVWALAQDQQGYLWIGSDAGLLRFDGSRFTPLEALLPSSLPPVAVRALSAGKNGDLWIGLDEPGGVARLQNGHLRLYGQSDGLPSGQVRVLIEDQQGVIWAGTSSGLFRLDGERWQAWPAGRGLEAGAVYGAHLTRNGDLLVGTDDRVYRRRRDADVFEALAEFGHVDGGVRGIVEDQHGRFFATDVTSGFRPLSNRFGHGSAERGRGVQMLEDRQGSLWVATGGQGVWRITVPRSGTPVVAKATVLTGLLAEGAFSLLEDRDGNIWAGTTDGLNRLTRHAVQSFTDIGIAAGVASTPDGSVWVATFDGLIEFTRRDGRWQIARRYLPGFRIRAIHADHDGRVWVATNESVASFSPGSRAYVPFTTLDQSWEVDSITSDGSGRVWLADVRRGLVCVERDQKAAPFVLPAAVRDRTVRLTYADRQGRIWLTFEGGSVAVVEPNGHMKVFGPREGASAGEYRAIYESRAGVVWLGGLTGLTRYADGRFATASRTTGFPSDYVKAVVEDEQGALWLGTSAGLVRTSVDEFDKALSGHPSQSSFLLLDRLDGVAGTPRLLGDRSAARDYDSDHLWFITGRGVTVVDPLQLKTPRTTTPVEVAGVTVDGQRAAPDAFSALKAGANKLEIEYSALNLSAPHKTRFRYRLDGFDTDWVDAGVRRTAFYTNLPPGSYQFRVAASTNGLEWNESRNPWRFSIEPQLYRTPWFLLLVVAAAALAAWAAWQVRLRHMRYQFSLLLGERTRLSREIHDTVLQGMVGVALQCDVLAASSESASMRRDLTRLRRRVEDYIRECRRSIMDLRSPSPEHPDLLTALRQVGAQAAGEAVAFDMRIAGTPRRCPPDVEQQLLRIAQEASSNAVRHAGANRLLMRVAYHDAAISLSVIDDGRGFKPDSPAHQEHGHCGLVTMAERAHEVGGELHIRSGEGRGTEIEAVVPIARAVRAS